MKLEFEAVDITAIAKEAAQEVLKALWPLMEGKGETEVILDVKGLAEYLKVSPQWVYGRVHLKEIPYSKIGKFPRFRKTSIDEWIKSNETPAINPLSKKLKLIR